MSIWVRQEATEYYLCRVTFVKENLGVREDIYEGDEQCDINLNIKLPTYRQAVYSAVIEPAFVAVQTSRNRN